MKIYYATHSETTDNADGIASGWKDVGLSEKGIQQSKEMGERFKDIKIDLICTSDLKRAVDTVKIAFEDRLPVIYDKRLREISYGDLNGHPLDEVYSIKHTKIKEPFPNGESFEQAVQRVQDFIKEFKAKHNDKTVLIVDHRATHYALDLLVGNRTLEECVNEKFVWQPWWEYEI
ncbi:histidine phosphatase family protein [Patescibacteria group bacterium]|nr:histidine phosphatase family protein [Patescibacteria group bacterium]MBU0964184.1 histidine phosphatase family protein [Patescibacteria group bacterium]